MPFIPISARTDIRIEGGIEPDASYIPFSQKPLEEENGIQASPDSMMRQFSNIHKIFH
jgi:hypothetical protein